MRAIAALVLAATGCSSLTSTFHCTTDEDCTLGSGRAGFCESIGVCSVQDTACPSGRRYSEYSGDQSNACTTGTECSVQVQAGERSTCVRRADDTVTCWGDGRNGFTQQELPAGALAEIDLAGGNACARYTNGDVVCWGGTAAPAGLKSRDLAVGKAHFCAITDAEQVACWGGNMRGQLGDNSQIDSASPKIVRGLLTGVRMRQVAVGGNADSATTCAVSVDNKLWCWGDNDRSQCGNGIDPAEEKLEPVEIAVSLQVATVAVGVEFACALSTSGQVWCWGSAAEGQVGRSSILGEENTPGLVPGLSGITRVTTGDHHACAIGGGGKVWCWGRNDALQGGVATAGNLMSPTMVNTTEQFQDIDGGALHTCAREVSSGAVQCWGRNVEGQIGNGTPGAPQPPTPVMLECR